VIVRILGRFGVLELVRLRPQCWVWRWSGLGLEFGPFRRRIHAVIDASHRCGLSAARAGWIKEL